MKTVDSSGVMVNEYEYDVYGTLRSSSGSQENEFEFALCHRTSSGAATYVAAHALFGSCGNPFEKAAGLEDGGYDQCG
jgi:hypothetical protein